MDKEVRKMSQYWNKDRIRAFIRLLAGKIWFYVIILMLLVYCMATMPLGPAQTQTAEVQIDAVSAFLETHSSIRSTRIYKGIKSSVFDTKGKTRAGFIFTDTEGNRYRLEGYIFDPVLVQGGCYTLTYVGKDGEYTLLGAAQGDKVLIDPDAALEKWDNNYVDFWVIVAASVFLLLLILRGGKKAYQDLQLWDYVQNHRD